MKCHLNAGQSVPKGSVQLLCCLPALLLGGSLIAGMAMAEEADCRVRIEVEGVRSDQGQVLAALVREGEESPAVRMPRPALPEPTCTMAGPSCGSAMYRKEPTRSTSSMTRIPTNVWTKGFLESPRKGSGSQMTRADPRRLSPLMRRSSTCPDRMQDGPHCAEV
jgi:hypothetical protein